METTKLLIVDDEEAFVAALERRLSLRETRVTVAYSGEEALKKLEETPDVEVVLLDVKMPGMDGIEALKRIKARHPLMEVIMLTGHATVETAIEGMKLGAFDYLKKPCEIDDLVTKLHEARDRRSGHLQKILEATGKELRGRRAR
jgi:DNA-binding NtrC family response regulator